ncbi:AraC family transcriptional regulator (plasmid) [Rhodococcus sp. ZPP]|uniref:AraC family transcriptional regulator n=1 Tax=Rhodococcus sp. ZPP TaxID=2749906 RepID=UPI001AD87C69|nr:AraC family transcriptional regulator [Rhodococcus sp. ZPP]QTJ70507.1 AraC family transcriptional regulator [Rhodococcus sp. ZPP]
MISSDTDPFTGISDPLTTHDLEEARTYIDQVYASHRLEAHTDRQLDFRHRYSRSGRLTIGHLTYGADVSLDIVPTEQSYHVCLPLQGRCFVEDGAERAQIGDGHAAILPPMRSLSVQWTPTSVQHVLKVPRAALEMQLARLVNQPIDSSPKFALDVDLKTGAAQALQSSVAFLWSELSRVDGLSTISLAREHLEQSILTQLLFAVDHQYSELLRADVRQPRPSRIRKVLDYIDAHPEHDLTTAYLAEIAGVTERALQAGFRKLVGVSPSIYVRDVRLERVHAELLMGPAYGTVTEIASRWGFYHLSRFAGQYKHRFGVLPSETMTRCR